MGRFSGHPDGEKTCYQHEQHDPQCLACLEADSYCPHGYLLKHFGDHRTMGCWRPKTKWDVEYPDLD